MTHDFWLLMATAFLIGLGSSPHCFAMCGGITCALGLQNDKGSFINLLLYQTGRIISYGVIGFLLGNIFQQIISIMPALMPLLRTFAALLLMAMALHTLKWWSGILVIEKAGTRLWRKMQPISRQFLPIRNKAQVIALGLLWGWLPCVLVYSTLSWAILQGNGVQASVLMLAFGAGTLPVLMFSSLAADRMRNLLQKSTWRNAMAIMLMACAGWTLYGAWHHAGQHGHSAHASPPQHNHSSHSH